MTQVRVIWPARQRAPPGASALTQVRTLMALSPSSSTSWAIRMITTFTSTTLTACRLKRCAVIAPWTSTKNSYDTGLLNFVCFTTGRR